MQGRGGGVECEGESECRAGAAVPGDPRVVDPPPLHPGRTPLRDSSACCFLEASAVPPLGGLWGGVMLQGGPQYCQAGNVCVEGGGGPPQTPFPPTPAGQETKMWTRQTPEGFCCPGPHPPKSQGLRSLGRHTGYDPNATEPVKEAHACIRKQSHLFMVLKFGMGLPRWH